MMFYPGDEVISTKIMDNTPIGTTGTIVHYYEDTDRYSVRLDKEVYWGHSCNGTINSKRGYYFNAECLDRIAGYYETDVSLDEII